MDANAHWHVAIGDVPSTLTVSIGHYPGAAQGAWKHVPIILLPRCTMFLNHAACSPCFFTSKHPCMISTVRFLVKLVPLTIHDAFNASPLP